MLKRRPAFSQILFSLSFLFSLLFYKEGWYYVLIPYIFFLWLWLSFIARKTVKNPSTHKNGSTITNLNIGCSGLIVFGIPYFVFVLGATKAVLFLLGMSCFGHILTILKNFQPITGEKENFSTLFQLLFYPWGVWTIQDRLRQDKF
jgi:hypothetical protein